MGNRGARYSSDLASSQFCPAMATLTMATLTMALITMALTMALYLPWLYLPWLTMAILTMAILTMATLTRRAPSSASCRPGETAGRRVWTTRCGKAAPAEP